MLLLWGIRLVRFLDFVFFRLLLFKMSGISKDQLRLLKEFVQICKAKPEVLHLPELAFYKEYLQR